MNKLIPTLALFGSLLFVQPVFATCSGQFGANQFCGTTTAGIPGPITLTAGSVTAPGGTVIGNNTTNPALAPATALINPILGIPGTSTGTIGFAGSTSGTATITPQTTAGTPTLTLPNTSGTFAVGVVSPLALNSTTGQMSITGAAGKVLAGSGPTFTATPVLGVAGTTVGSLGFQNAASGTETITPDTGALGSGIATLPAGTYNIVGDSLSQALTNKSYNGLTITSTTGTLTIAAGKTLTASNTLTFTGTDSTSFAFPGTSDTVVTLGATQTLTNKTLTSPTINSGALSGTFTGNATLSGNITYSGQTIHTGTSAPSSAAGNTVVMGTITAPTLTNNGQAFLYNTTANGAVLEGDGSTYDVVLLNKSGGLVFGVPTGTTKLLFPSLSSGTCSNGLGIDSGNNLILDACPGAATSIVVGTTIVTSGTTGYLLYNNSGTLGNETIASILTAGSGISITGTTNATINATVATAAGQVVGTSTNNNATAGNFGEFISCNVASGSAISLPSGNATDICNVSLTAGDWSCTAEIATPTQSQNMTDLRAWMSTTSATDPGAPNSGGYVRFGSLSAGAAQGGPTILQVGRMRFSLSGTTTVYFSGMLTYSSTGDTAYGFMGCRRAR